MSEERKILTFHIHPPIPDRSCDWLARYEDEEQGPAGWGGTEAEAIQDLKENYEGGEE